MFFDPFIIPYQAALSSFFSVLIVVVGILAYAVKNLPRMLFFLLFLSSVWLYLCFIRSRIRYFVLIVISMLS